MSGEPKDPAIKLFGKTIPLPEIPLEASSSSSAGVALENDQFQDTTNQNKSSPQEEEEQQQQQRDNNTNIKTDNEETQQDKENLSTTEQDDGGEIETLKESTNSDSVLETSENPKTPSIDKESSTVKNTKTEEEQSETSNSQDKPLKKPDKILPCPRCNSMDTKFCYYNNYNVNQPRHFCKNCQRYWTAGGTMRNVPVGAGRRKNKSSATNYRHITVSEALQNVRTDIPNGVHHPQLKPNGTVLAFGTDTPLCESMATVLNIAEKTLQNCTRNGFHKLEELKIPVPCGNAEKGIDHLSGPSVSTPNSNNVNAKNGVKDPSVQTCQNFPPQMPCFPGAPWPYPWNSTQWSPPVPPPAFCPPGFPMPFYPAATYWGCSMPAAWNVPWFPQPSSPNLTASGSGPNSPTLGKHSRDENMLKPSNSGEDEPVKDSNGERCLWIPKTLRIDDPREAAKSSIWSTLGIKHGKADSASGGGLLKAFQPKSEEKKHIPETPPVLQANPAALSRSLNFHESL